VIIPAGFPALSTIITQPISCLPISFDTPATVSFSFAVIGGRDIMSRTRMSGSASCTDNARWPSVGFYKIFMQVISLANIICGALDLSSIVIGCGFGIKPDS